MAAEGKRVLNSKEEKMRKNSHVYIRGALPFDTSTKRTPLAILSAVHPCYSRMIVLPPHIRAATSWSMQLLFWILYS